MKIVFLMSTQMSRNDIAQRTIINSYSAGEQSVPEFVAAAELAEERLDPEGSVVDLSFVGRLVAGSTLEK